MTVMWYRGGVLAAVRCGLCGGGGGENPSLFSLANKFLSKELDTMRANPWFQRLPRNIANVLGVYQVEPFRSSSSST